jgi:hypothetical protein
MKITNQLCILLILVVLLSFINNINCIENINVNCVNNGEFGNAVDGPAVTRSEVILTGDKYARLHWKMTEQNRRGVNCNGNFVSDYPVGDRVGMGYKWGGWDDIEDFTQKIKEGYGTGTGGYVSYEDYPFECVVGVSCTGFVSRAWHLDYKYTLNYANRPDIVRKFNRITQPVTGVDFENHKTEMLKKGDAFINAEHIILFIYETRSGKAKIMDSSSGGVSFRQLNWSFFSRNGYQALRYNNIKDENNPAGTKTNPIKIPTNSFPYTVLGNTRDVVSMEFDSYSTAPDINEQGPDVIYQLQVNISGTITINVTDIKHEGINNDVHLLKTLNKDTIQKAVDCITRADNTISQNLEAGIYYIIIDSNDDTPGEYTLTVNFEY